MKRYFLGAALSVLAAVQGSAALAQTVDELVVTAQRREQSAQDVGIALSVVTAEDLTRRGVSNVNDLQNATPSLEIEPAFGGGTPQFRIRGVGFQEYSSNNSPTVGIYINEVAFPVPVMTQGLIYDVERVEILRGPQGTLYGRNTTGGAVNILTKRPTDVASAGAKIEYGRFNHLEAEGFVSGPIGGAFRGRLSVATEQGGAFQHRRSTGESVGDADRLAGRALLQFKPNDRFDATLDVHAARDKSEASGLYLFTAFPTRGGAGPIIPADTDRFATDWQIPASLARDTGLSLDAVPGVDNKTWGAALNTSYDLGGVTLTNIASYDQLIRKQYGDWDASRSIEADTFFGSKVYVISDELRLSSNGEGPLQWVAGVYYSKQGLKEKYYSNFDNLLGFGARVNYDQDVESISVFGQAEYAFTDQWKITGGLRWEKETRDLQGFGAAFGGAQALPPTDVSTKMTPLTGKIQLDFKPTEDVLLYASASKGVKSGGFTTYNTGDRSGIQPFKPETLYAYEVGAKTEVLPGLRINASAFYYDYRDQQVLSVVLGANGFVGIYVNAPKSKIYGGELEATFQPTSALTITQSIGYKKGKYREFLDLDVAASRAAGNVPVYLDRAGQRMQFPEFSYDGSATYVWDLDAYEVSANVNYNFRDKYPSWLGTRYDVANAWLVNGELALRPAGGPWGIAVFGRNILGEKYDLTRNFFTNANVAQPGRPREYGVRLNVNF